MRQLSLIGRFKTQEEIDDMAGRHGAPSTGDGKKSNPRNKPNKTQVTVKTSGGTTLWKATASLFSKKGKSK